MNVSHAKHFAPSKATARRADVVFTLADKALPQHPERS